MNIYLLTQKRSLQYDTYDGLVVAAESVKDASTIEPPMAVYTWSPDFTVKLLGKAVKGIRRGIILSSYQAG